MDIKWLQKYETSWIAFVVGLWCGRLCSNWHNVLYKKWHRILDCTSLFPLHNTKPILKRITATKIDWKTIYSHLHKLISCSVYKNIMLKWNQSNYKKNLIALIVQAYKCAIGNFCKSFSWLIDVQRRQKSQRPPLNLFIHVLAEIRKFGY